MNIGMLWLDDNKQRSFEEKVQRAARYYREKYGRIPELCLVNSNMLPRELSAAQDLAIVAFAEEKKVEEIEVQPVRTVLPHHFWLGMKPANAS